MTTAAPANIDEAIDWLRKHFQYGSPCARDARYRVELSGEAGGVIGLEVRDGRLRVEASEPERPDVVVRVAASDWFAILAGAENADLLFTAGRIEIDGDLSLALLLRSLFQTGA